VGDDRSPFDRRLSRRQALGGGLKLAAAGAFTAYGGSLSRTLLPRPAIATKPAGSDLGAVEHVIFLMQENRSFDHYFGTYRGVRGFADRSKGVDARFRQPWPRRPGPRGAPVPPHVGDLDGLRRRLLVARHRMGHPTRRLEQRPAERLPHASGRRRGSTLAGAARHELPDETGPALLLRPG
jgi:hypothetical protein